MQLIWVLVESARFLFATHNIIYNHTLRHQKHRLKLTKRYFKWNHENCQNLYQKKSQNKYHHYWHFTTGQDILFSVNNNWWDKQNTRSGMQELPSNIFHQTGWRLDQEWLMLNEKLYFNDSHHLVETGNEKFAKCICLFLIFNRNKHHHCHHFHVHQHHYHHHHYHYHPHWNYQY